MTMQEYKNYVAQGGVISRAQALELAEMPLEELCTAADEIRRQFCGNGFDICTIINAKSGKCSENCKFCAQSAHYHTGAEEYPMLHADTIAAQAKRDDERGVLRFSLVTSGKRLTPAEVEQECASIRAVREQTGIAVCISNGLLDEASYRKLKEAGATRVHNNLESSRRFFPSVCTTHTFDEKCAAIRAAQAAGLSVCSGGIVGMGETMEDRIDMVLELRELGVHSIPVNMLNPIPGTPYETLPKLTNDDMCRIVAVFRFLIPEASIRLAGGRGLLPDKGRACFCSGANAAISGDMLTTSGITVETDMAMLRELGYEPRLCH
ncbi:biotin synthase BioB [Butyricicoccus sp.]|uniref:biotin synthase BioB n=1 Tax=Butyricicoccus sp. TaxID=2049021 RepID=UPI003736D6D8